MRVRNLTFCFELLINPIVGYCKEKDKCIKEEDAES